MYQNVGSPSFLLVRPSCKMQSSHRSGARSLNVCECVVLSIVGHLTYGAYAPRSGWSEHASLPEVLMRESHLLGWSCARYGQSGRVRFVF